MKNYLSRRNFIKFFGIGATSIVSFHSYENINNIFLSTAYPDLVISKGYSPGINTEKAIDAIGGIKRFVKKGDRVAILANPQGKKPPQYGTSTNPEVVGTVVRLCKEAEAEEILVIAKHKREAWELTGISQVTEKEGGIIYETILQEEFKLVDIPDGKRLRVAAISKKALEADVFINVPIAKDHEGVRMTGCMKNLMGINWENNYFHSHDIKHWEHCIVDLNTVIKIDLNIIDANAILVTNGPFGPGQIKSPQQVIATTNRVAGDSYVCELLGLKPSEIGTVKKAFERKLGEIDLNKIKIKRIGF